MSASKTHRPPVTHAIEPCLLFRGEKQSGGEQKGGSDREKKRGLLLQSAFHSTVNFNSFSVVQIVILSIRYLYKIMMMADRILQCSRILMNFANRSLVQYASTYMITAESYCHIVFDATFNFMNKLVSRLLTSCLISCYRYNLF